MTRGAMDPSQGKCLGMAKGGDDEAEETMTGYYEGIMESREFFRGYKMLRPADPRRFA